MQYKGITLDISSQECKKLDGPAIMQNIREVLKHKYGEEAFQSWLKHLTFVDSKDDTVFISVPTKFIKEWVCINYVDSMLKLWSEIDSSICSIEVCVTEEKNIYSEMRALFPEEQVQKNPEISTEVDEKASARLYSPIDKNLKFENFIADKSNELALVTAQRVAGSMCPDRMSNPLFLYGGVGLGKTHLMHAIANYVHDNMPWRKVIYLTAENFVRQFISAIKDKSIRELQDDLRSASILMIDDIQFIGGKEYTQEEFFHTFNDIVNSGRQLVISADRSPADMDRIKIEDRIKSRLSGGLIVDIGPTTFELRVGVLQKKSEEMNIQVPYDVMEYLAQLVRSNVRELAGTLNRVVMAAQMRSAPITLDLVQEIMNSISMGGNNGANVNAERIIRLVASYYEVNASDILSPIKEPRVTKARQVGIYLTKKLSDMSLADIGKCFGGRNHTTVMYSVKKIEQLITTGHSPTSEEVVKLIKKIKD